MSDRYKDEIEKILEDNPDLPKNGLSQNDLQEPLGGQIVSLFHLARNRKIGFLSAINALGFSVLCLLGFMATKFNLFAVLGVVFLVVSYLIFIWPTSFKVSRFFVGKLNSWFKWPFN